MSNHHTPVFEFDGKALDIWLTVKTGEVDMHSVVTVYQAVHGAVPCHDGILEGNLAVVCLECSNQTDIVIAHAGQPVLSY